MRPSTPSKFDIVYMDSEKVILDDGTELPIVSMEDADEDPVDDVWDARFVVAGTEDFGYVTITRSVVRMEDIEFETLH